ncbi:MULTISPECIES: hypothetical protein [Ferrimonas]|uniref:hypothetical protein n=1 Tax=Ferrimonas TaxID=44011 RepID=UPI000419B6C7|nr:MULTISPECIES: hypothetical protein [Ferrimonas]USD36199.1 hypothetical protein J8Z22_14290 [Ferrimonas sp. SCSIO 43195]
MAYVSINGVQYEKELLDMAQAHTTGVGEGRLSKGEVMDLINSARDGHRITDTELRTLHYIRDNFDFTDAAANIFDDEVGKF